MMSLYKRGELNFVGDPATLADVTAWLKAEGHTSGEWISVDKRPCPPYREGMSRSRCVLVYCPESQCTFTACYNFQDEGWEFFARGSVELTDPVSHWQPLPLPPTTTQD